MRKMTISKSMYKMSVFSESEGGKGACNHPLKNHGFIWHAIFFTCNEIRKQICESNPLLAVKLSQVKKRNKPRVQVRAM